MVSLLGSPYGSNYGTPFQMAIPGNIYKWGYYSYNPPAKTNMAMSRLWKTHHLKMYFLCRTKNFSASHRWFSGVINHVSDPWEPILHRYPTQPPFNHPIHPNHVTGTSPGRGPVLQQFVHLRAVPFGTANLLPKLARFAANLCKPRGFREALTLL